MNFPFVWVYKTKIPTKKPPANTQRAEIPRYHLSSPQPHGYGLMGTNIPQRDNGRYPKKPTKSVVTNRSAFLLQDVFQPPSCTCSHQPQALFASLTAYFFPSTHYLHYSQSFPVCQLCFENPAIINISSALFNVRSVICTPPTILASSFFLPAKSKISTWVKVRPSRISL